MKKFIRVMKALSDSNRIKIVKMLQHRELCVCEIREVLGLAQSTVSGHLKVLEEAGLVENGKDGLWVIYRQADGAESPYAACMLGNLRHWLSDDDEMQSLVQKLSEVDRNVICGR